MAYRTRRTHNSSKTYDRIKALLFNVLKPFLSVWLTYFIGGKPPESDSCRRCLRRNWNSSCCRKCRKRIRIFSDSEPSFLRQDQLYHHDVYYQENIQRAQYFSVNEKFIANAEFHQYGESNNFQDLNYIGTSPFEFSTKPMKTTAEHRSSFIRTLCFKIPKERNIPVCIWVQEANMIVAERISGHSYPANPMESPESYLSEKLLIHSMENSHSTTSTVVESVGTASCIYVEEIITAISKIYRSPD